MNKIIRSSIFCLSVINPAITFAQESDSLIYVREIRVSNESELSSLEIEVHLYEEISNDSLRFLGCSGEDYGLARVNSSYFLYVGLQATFQKADSEGFIKIDDIAGKNILLVVSEDDSGPCPLETNVGLTFPNLFVDDLIGKSDIMSGDTLASLQTLAFDDVVHLVIGAGEYKPPFQLTPDKSASNRTDSTRAACWADFNGDGWPDVFVANAKYGTLFYLERTNQLFLNNGDGTFSEVTDDIVVTEEGNSLGCTCGDYDNDGDMDLFVVNDGLNFLYSSNGDGTFTKVTDDPVVTQEAKSNSASWGDYDNDGFLDLFVANDGLNEHYHNNGDGRFTKIDKGIIVSEESNSTNCNWVDYDGDGDIDLFVTNTDATANFLHRNNGGGNFEKISDGVLVQDQHNSESSSWADYDNDGDLDVFVGNSSGPGSILYVNAGDGTFEKTSVSELTGPLAYRTAWVDIENDGDLDFVTASLFVKNLLKNYEFVRMGAINLWGAIWADYDGDGDLDVFRPNLRAQNSFFRNDSEPKSWLSVRCTGVVSNRSAIGAKVRAKATINGVSVWQLVEISAQTGRSAQNSLDAHFGLGDAISVDSLVIEWPSGMVDAYTNVAINQILHVSEGDMPAAVIDLISDAIPDGFDLMQNYPNPFNPSTTIRYSLPQRAHVTLNVFDVLGRKVATLVDAPLPVGEHAVVFDARGLPSGVYFYQITAGSFKQIRKAVLMR